jgi:hypothetical protein
MLPLMRVPKGQRLSRSPINALVSLEYLSTLAVNPFVHTKNQ